ncbi:MAG: adenine deaminase [Paracoccaceae bacterium]|nr:adenine deaminase [Paracoccaceae bacterium]
MKELEDRISKGLGDQKADLVLKGGIIFNLITGDLTAGDIAINGDTIVGTYDDYDGKVTIDLNGSIVVPGFIDTHLHIESSMLTPLEFDRCVTPRGVTTAICDPHEIANVIGIDGIKYFQRASECTLMDIKVQIPSCVPSTTMETSGAKISAQDISTLMSHKSSLGLAEMMNYPGVILRELDVLEKLWLYDGKHIDGHAPRVSGKELNAYISSGISTDHESTDPQEALEKIKKGLRILIREGSVSKDLKALSVILNENTSPYICLCTDDRNPLDIAEYGHLDYMIRTLISLGVSPLAAYRSASLSAAQAFGLTNRGLIAPGKRADIVVIDSLENCKAQKVFCAGKLVDEEAFHSREDIADVGRFSVMAPHVLPTDFRATDNQEKTDVIGIIEGKIITKHLIETISIKNGDKVPDIERDLIRISVIERHGVNGNISTGFVKGFGLKSGAIASTVAHDHHNIIVVGTNYEDIAVAVNRLGEIEGGFAIANRGIILGELPLPLAGLMSPQSYEKVENDLRLLRKEAHNLGVSLEEPFLQLSFLALPVIPALKITDRGMIDVTKFEIL